MWNPYPDISLEETKMNLIVVLKHVFILFHIPGSWIYIYTTIKLHFTPILTEDDLGVVNKEYLPEQVPHMILHFSGTL